MQDVLLVLQMPGDPADVQSGSAAKGEEGKFAWINATLYGQEANALGHSGRDHLVHPIGCFHRAQAEGCGDVFVQCLLGQGAVEALSAG